MTDLPRTPSQSKDDSKPKPPCAGVVVVRGAGEHRACLLLKSEVGHWGFPKGKRERGETTLQTALRELHEETSLCAENIVIRADVQIDEMSDKGNLAVRYLVATVAEPCAQVQCDPDHVDIAWVPVEQARAWLRPSRRAVLEAALAELSR